MSNKRIPLNRINPLRYPGGKRWLTPYIERIFDINSIRPHLFVEPFAGGAGVSLQLLCSDKVEAIGLADKDPLIASFWQTVFFDTQWLLDEIENTPITLESWKYFKTMQAGSIRELAFQCLFLNRTNFSGILAQDSGPIGGMTQKSSYKIDCRFNKKSIIEVIDHLSINYRHRVLFVWNKSWRYTIGEMARRIDKGNLNGRKILIYLDPPFFHKAEKLYRFSFNQKEHISLRNALEQCKLPWVLSYDDCDESRYLYRGLAHSSLDVLYCLSSDSSSSKSKSELIISNLPNTLSEIIPSRKSRRRTSVSSSNGKIHNEKDQEALCQSNTRILQTGTR
jgi:DNA adenine methylase